ncbi:TIGR04211 family SH3 domain-containing protein [Thiomicrospira microaerophila]|uniref:TIGR04211 family SH3 domain-containing protein n=1 Tax=Thiomicrospira microaerophila TaxID=406020 RepID=UPI0005C9EFFA|nr:TIGR04211 family SH3 domain-containing protein [Thiomicrospira microaerophila]
MAKFNSFKRKVITAGLSVCFSLPLTAMSNAMASEGYTHYISDRVEVPMRRGSGPEYRIERMLPTGTPIKILETTGAWSRVEVKINNRDWTGWVFQNAIQNEPPARLQLIEQIERTQQLNERFRQLESEHNTLREQYTQDKQELERIKQAHFELNNAHDELKLISGNAVEMDNRNQEMRQMINDLESQNIIMREQIAKADDTIKRQWFLTGAGVLLLGLLLGRFFRLPQKRGSWDKI